ncbi:MAG: hypothetical protein JWN76_41 [Chitinophagaceae bacterium]|nr:hypothetical protein [Chitinophagaceae bacterium]
MYKAIRNLAAFKEGQLLVKTKEFFPEHMIPAVAAEQNEFFIVKEVEQDKIIFQRAKVQGKGKSILYSSEEIPIKEIFTGCCWYVRNLK